MIVFDKNDFAFDSESSGSSSDEVVEKIGTSLTGSACEKTGWLMKQSDNILKTWSWRFFVLNESRLLYYRKMNDLHPAGVINFNQVCAKLEVFNPERPRMLRIRILGITYSFNIKSPSPFDLADWALHLQSHIDASQGKVNEISLVNVGEKLWKHERVSEYFFRTHASTGDLILFRNKDIGSVIQRGFTRSSYDHVALLLCYTSGKICLLEAIQSTGVNLLLWSDFKKYQWNLLTERIVHRKLEFERTEESLVKLEEFVNKVVGKAYKLSTRKIVMKNPQKKPGDETDFFCSELIASAYKVLGVLSEEEISNRFLPGSFAEDGNLQLIGAKLGPECVIDFDL